MKRLSIKLALLAGAAACSLGAQAAEKLTVQMKWVPQAQFAGYYVAQAKGYYKAEGLDVTIKPGGPDVSPVQVIAGHYCTETIGMACDHIEESMLPVEALGRRYLVTAPQAVEHSDFWFETFTVGERYLRIIATEPNTTIAYDPPDYRRAPGQEPPTNLADAVMMRQRASGVQNLVARGMLELGIYRGGVVQAFVAEPEIEINTDPGLIHLGHPAGHEGLSLEAAGRVLPMDPALDVVRERDRLAPRHRGLE